MSKPFVGFRGFHTIRREPGSTVTFAELVTFTPFMEASRWT